MFKFALACTGLAVLYSVYRLRKHDRALKALGQDPIVDAIRRSKRDEFAGWEKEVERIYRDSSA